MNENKQTITFTLKGAEAVQAWNDFKDNYEKTNNASLTSSQSVAEMMLETATSKFKPYVLDEKEKEELKKQLDQQLKIVEELESKLNAVTLENSTRSERLKNYKEKNEELSAKTSDILIKYSDLNPTLKVLITKYISKPDIIKLFDNYNKNGLWKKFGESNPAGTYNQFFNVINLST